MENLLKQWQQLCKKVRLDLINYSFKATAISGKSQIKRFNLRETDGTCQCHERQEDVRHIMYTCNLRTKTEARNKIRRAYGDLDSIDIQLRKNRKLKAEQLDKLEKWVKEVLEEETYQEDEDESEEEHQQEAIQKIVFFLFHYNSLMFIHFRFHFF